MKWNYCPECGHRVYQHGPGGCQHTEVNEDGHVVRIANKDGQPNWTLKHPAVERENNNLFDCPIAAQLSGSEGPVWFPVPGDYRIEENENGGWSFEQPAIVRVPCDCTVTHPLLAGVAG